MKRFAPLEAVVLLLLESDEYPMHIAAMQVFRPPEGAGPGFAREIYEAMRTHTEFDKKFAGHPATTRRGTSVLRWNYEPEIDIDDHLHYTSLPAPGGNRELLALISDLHGRLLDRHRPLWEVHVIDGLSDGRFATFIKGHHALADGVSGTRMSQQALSTDPHDDRIRVGWAPRPENREAAAPRATRKQAAGPVKLVAQLGRSLPLLRAALRERQLIPVLRAPRTMFNVRSDGSRRCEAQSFSADRVKVVAVAAGVTFNDVALAMCAGALRAYLTERNALPGTPLVAWVPVNLRAEDDALGGNIIGAGLCNLATDLDDPAKRLETVHASMQHNIKLIRDLPREVAIELAGVLVAPISGRRGLRAKIPPIFNLGISYVRGDDEPLYRRGALLEDLYGFLPLLRGQALNVGLVATSENLDFGLAACARAVPDLDRLAAHLEPALKDLERAVGL